MKYKHTNLKQGTFSVKDSKGVCYALEPGKELILDMKNVMPGMIKIEQIEKEEKEEKEEKANKYNKKISKEGD